MATPRIAVDESLVSCCSPLGDSELSEAEAVETAHDLRRTE